MSTKVARKKWKSCVKSQKTKWLRAGEVDFHINTASEKLHKNTVTTNIAKNNEMIKKKSKENESWRFHPVWSS